MIRPFTSLARAARWQQPLAIIVVLSAMLTTSTPAAPDVECVPVDDLLEDGVIEVHGDVTLCAPGSGSDPVYYGVHFDVKASDLVLDCGRVMFDGDADGILGPDPDSRAMDFDNVSPAIRNVVVRNCKFRNYENGIHVTGGAIADLPEIGLVNIRLQDITFSGIGASAIKIGAHNRDNLVEAVKVTNSRTAVYLEANSSRTTIRGSRFTENGDWSDIDNSDGREAISIDGSSHNVITDNFFKQNKYGAIALYKNCGEDGTRREAGANYNIIERNEFYKHGRAAIDNDTGLIRGGAIVIASRQGLDIKDGQDAWGAGEACTDLPAYDEDEDGDGNQDRGEELYRDVARYNVVRNNAFAFNLTAIRVRDSFNHIEGNTFAGDHWTDPGATDAESDDTTVFAQHDVVVDARLLDLIGAPAIGITVVNNVTLTETSPAGKNFVKIVRDEETEEYKTEPVGAPTLLFENNVDRYYQCVPDALAKGNRCNALTTQTRDGAGKVKQPGKEPLNRCEVTGIPAGCPSRDEMTELPGVPDTWLATLYGANILPDVCEERAEAIWNYCEEELGRDDFEIKTTAVVDGYYDDSRKWSYAGPP